MKRTWMWVGCVVVLMVLGAVQARADYYVAQNDQTSAVPYTSWATAASNIQDAVNQVALSASETIWIDSGRYTVPTNAVYDYYATNIVYAVGKKISFRGFSGDPADTVINGEGKYRGFAAVYDGSAPDAFTFDALTMSNCVTTNYDGGSGIYLYSGDRQNSRPWTSYVYNCVFTDSEAVRGGGIHFNARGPGRKLVVSNCVFRNNQTSSSGGALYTYKDLDLQLIDCSFENNQGASSAVSDTRYANLLVERCVVSGNSSDKQCIGLGECDADMRNSLFCGNTSGENGLMFASNRGYLDMHNCTVVSNDTQPYGAIYLKANSSVGVITCKVVNCVMYSNTDWNVEVYADNPIYGTMIVSNSCSSYTNEIPNFYANNNITNDPKFVNFDAGDFRLANGSLCIDAGTNLPWTADAIDLDGNPRRDATFGLVDMGCYEYLYHGTAIMVQ